MSKITKRKYVEQEVMEFVLPSEHQQIVKVTGGRGNNLHEVVDAENKTFLVSMPNKFRKNIWVKRGDFVIIDPIEEGDKVRGEITHILFQQHIQHIQEEGLWPKAFGSEETKSTSYIEDDLLPPSESDSDDDGLGTRVFNVNKHSQLYEEHSSEEDDDEEGEDEEEEDGDDGERVGKEEARSEENDSTPVTEES